jgi:hypothetical protein
MALSIRLQRQKASREEFASALRELQPEARSKLRILMTAGRDGLSLGSAHASRSSGPPGALDASGLDAAALDAAALDAAELEGAGVELGDYLARGHAIACATEFDLEASLERWSTSERGKLEERVWLRFGKQLASAPPEEWECLGAVSAGGERLAQLYLRSGKAVWWSFGAVLDRPAQETVRKTGRTRAGRSSKLGPLGDVAARRSEPQRRALQRALRAIRARVGKPLEV